MREIVSLQREFPLGLVVCAWCKPKTRGMDLGAGLISHGICPRHMKKMSLELQTMQNATHPAHPIAARSRRRKTSFNHPELNYQA